MSDRVAEFETSPPEDARLARLARELLAAVQVARSLRMLIQVSFKRARNTRR